MSEEGIVGSLTYATALFEHATVERWMGHWRHLLDAMVTDDGWAIGGICWMRW
ncbi:hypothetical protein [Xanthomonas sp. MUS 060]|uniref:hypothetical protein n=1 Tax=Xanthomonas sp. MUS 060 TaxID=1588031 RepID=UPI000A43D3B3|nr:hypothetical protein [Xanthomonas sp. MUS 060]